MGVQDVGRGIACNTQMPVITFEREITYLRKKKNVLCYLFIKQYPSGDKHFDAFKNSEEHKITSHKKLLVHLCKAYCQLNQPSLQYAWIWANEIACQTFSPCLWIYLSTLSALTFQCICCVILYLLILVSAIQRIVITAYRAKHANHMTSMKYT